MKIQFMLLILFFSAGVFAEQLYCNVDVHGFDREKWRDYPDNTFIIEYDNNTLNRLDTKINLDDTFAVIKNNNEVVIGILVKDSYTPGISTVRTITIHKDKGEYISTYNDDLGITINKGICFNY